VTLSEQARSALPSGCDGVSDALSPAVDAVANFTLTENTMPNNPNEVGIALLQQEVANLRHDVTKLTTDIEGLVDAWKTAENVVAFVKWVAGLGTVLVGLWAAIRLKFGL